LPPVAGRPTDLRRLARWLYAAGVRAAGPGGAAGFAAEPDAAGVRLRLEAAGDAGGVAALARMVQSPSVCAEQPNGLEVAACQSLVRRLGGALAAEAPRPGAVAVVVTLPAPSP
jgi:hypothetical protein